MAAASIWVGALNAFQQARQKNFDWHPSLRDKASELMAKIEQADPQAVETALKIQAEERLKIFLDGVQRYQDTPRQKGHALPQVIAKCGAVSVHDYGGSGPLVFIIPSLVNPAHILDLEPQNSLIGHLKNNGLHPLLLNWGWPDEEKAFDLDAYIGKRLLPLIDDCVAQFNKPMAALGYCMGGMLALAAAVLRPKHISKLALLATPWDFHGDGDGPAQSMQQYAREMEPVMKTQGVLPAEALQLLFASLDPTLVERKFRHFAELEKGSSQARAFVALEDWANSGAPLSAPAARDMFNKCYGDNLTAKGEWTVAGTAIRPELLNIPALAFIPQNDRIVPPQSARALAEALKADIQMPHAGHVGMVIGRRAKSECWQPLTDWLLKN
jgi:polyhydroxyalkanoate synthase